MSGWKMVAVNTAFALLFALVTLVAFAQAVVFLSIEHYGKGGAMAVLACLSACNFAHVIATTREWLEDDRVFDAKLAAIVESIARKDWNATDRGLDDARAFVASLNAKLPPRRRL
jgi:hypothetical protein